MESRVENVETGMEMRDLLQDASFTHRKKTIHDPTKQLEAFQRLARVFAERADIILQELVDIAVEFCGADSSGISLEERNESGELRFRWIAIAGSFSHFLHGTTPRFFSPCGTCLNRGVPQLYRVTKPYYDFLQIEAEPITDGILIPWLTDGMRGTLWAVAHNSREAFDFDDYKLLASLADFASIALRHQTQQVALRKQERIEAYITMANELAHQINNPLQSVTNALYLAGRGGEGVPLFVQQASQELDRVTDVVRKLLVLKDAEA